MAKFIERLLSKWYTPEGRVKLLKWFWFIATFMLVLGYFVIAYLLVQSR